jgi:hypothetical protein
MTEFTFGGWGVSSDPLFGLGFKSVNVTNARIAGAEVTFNAEGSLGSWKLFIASGYTHVCPIDADAHPELSRFVDATKYAIKTFNTLEPYADSPLLKYRYRHMGKCNVDVEHASGLTFGAGLRAYSFMERFHTRPRSFPPNEYAWHCCHRLAPGGMHSKASQIGSALHQSIQSVCCIEAR